MPSNQPLMPTEQEVERYFQTCTNWGCWGADDNLGAVNLITPAKRKEAMASVCSGRAVSLARPLATQGGGDNINPVQHFLCVIPGRASIDFLGINYQRRLP